MNTSGNGFWSGLQELGHLAVRKADGVLHPLQFGCRLSCFSAASHHVHNRSGDV
jgi:hypothetical protein